MRLIVEESDNAQYFVTSFKEAILEIPSEVSNFYVVDYENRKSSIKRVNKDDAKEFLRTIVNEWRYFWFCEIYSVLLTSKNRIKENWNHGMLYIAAYSLQLVD